MEDHKIRFYKASDEFGCFSNFSKHPIFLDGVYWKTVEHYYQAKKFNDVEIVLKIQASESPMEAADIGRDRANQIRNDWDTVKIDIMRRALLSKISQNRIVRERLLSTGNAEIIEDSPYDPFWGSGPAGTGTNMLGKLLMELREQVKTSENKEIIPPWLFNQIEHPSSMFWRMGKGEDFLVKWQIWYDDLPAKNKKEYLNKYPIPKEWDTQIHKA